MRRTNSRLAAHAHARQLLAVSRADTAALAVSRVVRRARRALALLLRRPPCYGECLTVARAVLAELFADLQDGVRASVSRQARLSAVAVRASLRRALPARALRHLARRRGLCESVEWGDLLSPWRDEGEQPTADELAALLFPPPDEGIIQATVYDAGWLDRFLAGSSLGSPSLVAAQIAGSLLAGQSPPEIARQIEPMLAGVEASARRVARTESMRVAQAVQLRMHEQLGDLVIGWQVRATLDRNTRSWHAKRDGQVYYLAPGPGQKGMQQCPNPPDEAIDPAERPPGAPATAWCCRCFLVPVLRDVDTQ